MTNTAMFHVTLKETQSLVGFISILAEIGEPLEYGDFAG